MKISFVPEVVCYPFCLVVLIMSMSGTAISTQAGPEYCRSTPNSVMSVCPTLNTLMSSPNTVRSVGLPWIGSGQSALTLPPQVGRSGGRKRSGIPRSTNASREASPQRFGATPLRGQPRPPPSGAGARPPVKPLLTEKILRQSREAETALADALVCFVSLYFFCFVFFLSTVVIQAH